MRALAIAIVVVVAGCAQLAGLEDPKPAPADGNGCAQTCDLEDNCGCTSAQTCRWDGNSGAYACRSDFGAGDLMQGCVKDTDCKQGLSCLFGECRKYCANDPQCGATLCKANWVGFYPGITCADACTPITNAGCPGALACLVNQGAGVTFCLPGDTVPLGADCASASLSCVPGAICHDESGAHVCRAQCDPNGAACASGTCTPAPDLKVDGVQYGVCI